MMIAMVQAGAALAVPVVCAVGLMLHLMSK